MMLSCCESSGCPPPQPTKDLGSVVSSPPPKPRPPTHFWHIWGPQNITWRPNQASFFPLINPLNRRLWGRGRPRLTTPCHLLDSCDGAAAISAIAALLLIQPLDDQKSKCHVCTFRDSLPIGELTNIKYRNRRFRSNGGRLTKNFR